MKTKRKAIVSSDVGGICEFVDSTNVFLIKNGVDVAVEKIKCKDNR